MKSYAPALLLPLLFATAAFAAIPPGESHWKLVNEQLSEPAMACPKRLQLNQADSGDVTVSNIFPNRLVVDITHFARVNQGATCVKQGAGDMMPSRTVCNASTRTGDRLELEHCESRGLFQHDCRPTRDSGHTTSLELRADALTFEEREVRSVNWRICEYVAE